MWRNAVQVGVLALCATIALGAATVSQATTVTIQTDSDTSVWANAPTNNFGASQVSTVGRQTAKSGRYRSLLHLDLSVLPRTRSSTAPRYASSSIRPAPTRSPSTSRCGVCKAVSSRATALPV